jgi:hypothetical protein
MIRELELQSKLEAVEARLRARWKHGFDAESDSRSSGPSSCDEEWREKYKALQKDHLKLQRWLAQKEQTFQNKLASMEAAHSAMVKDIQEQSQAIQAQYRAACEEKLHVFKKNCEQVVQGIRQQCAGKITSREDLTRELAAARAQFEHDINLVKKEHAEWSEKQAVVAAELQVNTERDCAQKLADMERKCKQEVDETKNSCEERIATAQKHLQSLVTGAQEAHAALLSMQPATPDCKAVLQSSVTPTSHVGNPAQSPLIDATLLRAPSITAVLLLCSISFPLWAFLCASCVSLCT